MPQPIATAKNKLKKEVENATDAGKMQLKNTMLRHGILHSHNHGVASN